MKNESEALVSHSVTINELATALAKAQAKIQSAHKDKDNPFFRSKYADLTSVWDACRKDLTDNGLSVLQMPFCEDKTAGVITYLLHSSGQFIASKLSLPMVPDKKGNLNAQTAGSAQTYARRYALAGFVGVTTDDDDGKQASQNTPQKPVDPNIVTPAQLKRMFALLGQSALDATKLREVIKTSYGKESSRELTKQEYESVCRLLEAEPKQKTVSEDNQEN